jgi:hypothetical protein
MALSDDTVLRAWQRSGENVNVDGLVMDIEVAATRR